MGIDISPKKKKNQPKLCTNISLGYIIFIFATHYIVYGHNKIGLNKTLAGCDFKILTDCVNDFRTESKAVSIFDFYTSFQEKKFEKTHLFTKICTTHKLLR